MKYAKLLSCAACILVPITMCAQSSSMPPATGQCKTVYVQDFDLEVANFKGDTGLLSKLPEANVPRPHIIRKKKETPEQEAQDLVNVMSTSLIKDLTKAGYTAQRLRPDDPKPTSGWLVQGVFTSVSEGNRVHRAVIGFGSGADKMELHVSASNAQDAAPLYAVDTKKSSSKMPGAAVTLNPIAVGAKFVMEKNAPERTVKSAASQISGNLVKQMSASNVVCN